MWNGIIPGFLCTTLYMLSSVHPAQANESRYMAQGYWAWTQNSADAGDRYLRITGDSGYYCSLDGKSGFAFTIVKDSITTPMNGKNPIQYMPNSGAIVINGSEKGAPYYDRFETIDSTTYWGQCRDQDKPGHVTDLRVGGGRQPADWKGVARGVFPWQREGYSLSGRKSKPIPSGRNPSPR